MNTPDDSPATMNTTYEIAGRSFPPDKVHNSFHTNLALILCLSILVIVSAIVSLAVMTVRLMKKMNGEEERMAEGTHELRDPFSDTTQHTRPPRSQSDRVPGISRNIYENRGVSHTENFTLEREYRNTNMVENDTVSPPMTPRPVQCAPRSDSRVVNHTNEAECRQQWAPPLGNTTYGSFSTISSSPEPEYAKRGTDRSPLYDRPLNTAVPINRATQDNPLYDRPSNIAVPVERVTQDNALYDHPSNIAVPVDRATQDNPLYDHPPNIAMPVDRATQDNPLYDRPSNIAVHMDSAAHEEYVYDGPLKNPVPQKDAKYSEFNHQRPQSKSVPGKRAKGDESNYDPLSHTKVPENGVTADVPLYDRLPTNSLPIKDATRDNSTSQHPTYTEVPGDHARCDPVYDRPPAYPAPVPDPANDSVYERLSTLLVPESLDCSLYDHPRRVPMAVESAGGTSSSQDKSLFPRPPPRPSKRAAVVKVQENLNK